MRNHLNLFACALSVFLLSLSCGDDGDDESGSSEAGKIAFTFTDDDSSEIYVADANGNNRTKIVPFYITDQGNKVVLEGQKFDPEWSPDGTQIVFSCFLLGNQDIYVMDADGNNVTRHTDTYSGEYFPAWSPNGTQIAFTSDRDDNYQIYVMDAECPPPAVDEVLCDVKPAQRRLTDNSSDDYSPAWSRPAGTQIAFTSNRDGNEQIYVMSAGGSDQTNISNNSSDDKFPAWSPDGTQIAFYSVSDGDLQIHVMDAGGSNQRNISNSSSWDRLPAWSPDGTQIAFTRGARKIYVMEADGSNQRNISHSSLYDSSPAWKL